MHSAGGKKCGIEMIQLGKVGMEAFGMSDDDDAAEATRGGQMGRPRNALSVAARHSDTCMRDPLPAVGALCARREGTIEVQLVGES